MKVFLSWSGDRSREVANLLSDWLSCVIQACRPWISTRDLDRGSLWFGEIHDQLRDTSVGIICLTQENKLRPWILFEAGSLAKGLSTARVCTFLIDLEAKDIQDPLAQFNHTFPQKESVRGLVRTLNAAVGPGALEVRVLDQVFNTYWPQFENSFKEILKTVPEAKDVKPREAGDVLGEILELTRELGGRVRRLERSTEETSVRPSFMRPPNISMPELMEMVNRGLTHEEAEKLLGNPISKDGWSAIVNTVLRNTPRKPRVRPIDDGEAAQ